MATFKDLQSGGIRGLLPPDDPAASYANRILAVACAPAQASLDNHLRNPADIHDETLVVLESWRSGLKLAEAAMAEARDLTAANPGTLVTSTDSLGYMHVSKVF